MDDTPNNRAISRLRLGALTTRRSFIAAASLGAVSLYGLWAGLGAAPLRFWAPGRSSGDAMDLAGTGSHEGHGSAQGPTADEFRRMTEEFVARHQQPDGSVLVEPEAASPSMAGMTMPADSHGSAHTMPGMAEQSVVHAGEVEPLDIFMLAQQFSFDPSLLRLRTGIPYRFKLMAADVAHGASLQLGSGSNIIRLPKEVLVERQLVFSQPGEYLLYCTVYCGEGHQLMHGKIQVS